MDKLIPIYYTLYGRYVSRFRSIPLYADALIPVQRRLLLCLHEIARGPKTIKSAKIVGHAIGNYHAHGDTAAYGSLVNLAKQGFLKTQGNFGSPGLDDSNASAMRYTECHLKKWVEDFCFKYIDFVPWENFEYENEPLFLPCPLPLGLIGDGDIYLGVAFHKCVMPRYKIPELAKRLRWLLKGGEEPIIYPNFESNGCSTYPDDAAAKSILNTGIGTLTLIPESYIDNTTLHICGRVPQTSYNKLREDTTISINCMSGKTIDIEVKPTRKQEDIQSFYDNIYKKYLIKNINFNICVCDEEGTVTVRGVDELLQTCYGYYVECVKYKLIDDCNKEIIKKYENEIILIIRNVFNNNPTVKTIEDLIKILRAKTITSKITISTESYDLEKDIWISNNSEIEDSDIKNVCNNRTIKSLIEQKINIDLNDLKIIEIKKQIVNNDVNCFKLIEKLCL